MKFAFISTHRGVWPAGWLREALGVSLAVFFDWRTRSTNAVAPNVLDRTLSAANRKWGAGFTCLWTAEGWFYVDAVVDLFSRRVIGWPMHATRLCDLYRCPCDGDLAAW